MDPLIRAPRPDELESLRAIERAAGTLFAQVGLDDVAADEPETIEALGAYLAAGRIWVICLDDMAVGYGVVDIVDGAAHLEQMSVDPRYGRRGLGAALLTHVFEWARLEQFEAVTLTTFGHLPWNAPFYAKQGFRVLDDTDVGPELRQRRADETARGLDPELRVCMRRDL